MEHTTGQWLAELIKACAENGVTTFKQGDLEINFGNWPTQKRQDPIQSTQGGAPLTEEDTKPALPMTNMDDLLIENPEAYEDALVAASNS